MKEQGDRKQGKRRKQEEGDRYILLAGNFLMGKPIYFDKNLTWWEWIPEKYSWEQIDETDILNELRARIPFLQISTVKQRKYILEAFRQVGRTLNPKEPSKEWIQFRNEFYNIKTGERKRVTDEWFSRNPIPHSIGESEETPEMDKLLTEWVGAEWVQSLYEIIAYCCYRGGDLQTIICLIGGGANGKGKFKELLTKFIGEDNVVSTDLENLCTNVFESSKLWGKLVAAMGETNFNVLSRTAKLKELTGEDKTDFQMKFKPPWSGYHYATLLICTNSLPITEDNTTGFFRRWLIIDFPRRFKIDPELLDRIPDAEYPNLARKVVTILPQLLKKGAFTNQGDYDERRKKYEASSNPFPHFLKEEYVRDNDKAASYGATRTHYNKWLKERNRRQLSFKDFNQVLTLENLEVKKTSINGENDRFILEIARKSEIQDYEFPPEPPPDFVLIGEEDRIE